MRNFAEIEARLLARLTLPESQSTVPGSLPVLFFGDLVTAKVASLGLNPSPLEYRNRGGRELEGEARRFETLRSLGVENRDSLTTAQCNQAIAFMRNYFEPGRPVYRAWFGPMSRVMEGLGFRYEERGAVHLDLVQEATDPAWSRLLSQHPAEATALLEQDQPFLMWQLETFPLRVLVCNGRKPLDTMIHLLHGNVVASGAVSGRRRWTIANAEVGGRRIAVAGWNIPLANAPGLTKEEQIELGCMLRQELVAHGFLAGDGEREVGQGPGEGSIGAH